MLVINEVDQSHLGDGSRWMMLELKNHVERKAIAVVFFLGGAFTQRHLVKVNAWNIWMRWPAL